MSTLIIQAMIAHDIDLENKTFTESRRVIDIPTIDDSILAFFTNHISKANTTRQIRTCKFKHDKAKVLVDCLEILNEIDNKEQFIQITSRMANRLFDIMESSTSTSSGTLFCLIYTDTETSALYFGIMKMDRNDGIQYNRDKNSFRVQKDILPSVREKLHKIAFIKMREDVFSQDSHLFVLDKQQTAEPSKFFLKNFLEAEPVVNDEKMTDLVQRKLNDFNRECMISAVEIDSIEFNQKVDRLLASGKAVDLDTDLDTFFAPYIDGEEDRGNVIESFKEALKQENEDSYYQFTADRKDSLAIYTADSEKKIRIQVPKAWVGGRVKISNVTEDGRKVAIIKIIGTHLKPKI